MTLKEKADFFIAIKKESARKEKEERGKKSRRQKQAAESNKIKDAAISLAVTQSYDQAAKEFSVSTE